MAISDREKEAAKAAQSFMSTKTEKNLVPDGWWGSYTQSVYNRLDVGSKTATDAILASYNMTASRLAAAYAAEKLIAPDTKQSFVAVRTGDTDAQKTMAKLVREIAVKEGVPPETALKIIWLESKFNPKAVSPTGARGLGQFTGIAITDVRERGGFTMTDPFDPVQNATATMRLIKLVSKDMKVPMDDAARIYMGFNIGATAAKDYLAGRLTPAVKKGISQQIYGPPEVYGSNLTSKVLNAPVLA